MIITAPTTAIAAGISIAIVVYTFATPIVRPSSLPVEETMLFVP